MELSGACVTVGGRCTVASGAELRLTNCSNVDSIGGGGVFAIRDLHVDGALEVHQSHSRRGRGGGVYVLGASAQLLEPWRRA